MEQALLIVWRESVEALLVIGILFAWLRQQPGRRHAMAYLWGGVGLGLLLWRAKELFEEWLYNLVQCHLLEYCVQPIRRLSFW